MTDYIGGCACGAVRYHATARPLAAFHCQCRQCQRASGTGHASLFVMPRENVTLQGELRYFEQTADDGATISRGFCPNCGSPVLGFTSGKPSIYIMTAASLDDPTLFQPTRVVFHDAAPAWDHTDPHLPIT